MSDAPLFFFRSVFYVALATVFSAVLGLIAAGIVTVFR
jgi:hypothetical protein